MRCSKCGKGWTQNIDKPNITKVKCPSCGAMNSIRGQLVLIRADLVHHYGIAGVIK